MKKLILIALIAFMSGNMFSQVIVNTTAIDSVYATQSPALQAAFYTVPFYSPIDGPYIETYLSVFGSTLSYFRNDNNKAQASVSITMLFKQEEKVVEFRKYNLLSPEVNIDNLNTIGENFLRNLGAYIATMELNGQGTEVVLPNFIDIQRISLPMGIYDIEMIIKDNSSDSTGFTYNATKDIQFDISKVQISGIQIIESYAPTVNENVLSKSGYDIVPYISDYFPSNINNLTFYAEVYNSDKVIGEANAYLVKTYIEGYETTKSLHDFNKFYKQETGEVNIILNKFKIQDLPSGNYNLVVEIVSRENKMLDRQKIFFQRNNPSAHFIMDDIASISTENTFISYQNNIDTLGEYLKCLLPIADISEHRYIDNLLKQKNTELMKQFIYNFWYTKNSMDPGKEWLQYKKKVEMVNMSYTTFIKKGYETDRGRVYLQYGVPNTIREKKHEPNAYPYEVWHYYSLNGISDQKFLFYNPALVGDDYVLLHSNVPGEMITANWEETLISRTQDPSTLLNDSRSANDIRIDRNYGSDAREIWENP